MDATAAGFKKHMNKKPQDSHEQGEEKTSVKERSDSVSVVTERGLQDE